MNSRLPEHQRPDGVSDETVSALGKLSDALEATEAARGHLYSFHRLTGTADLTHGEAVERELVGRNVLERRWTFQIVEEYDDTYYAAFKDLEKQARDDLVGGRRHLFEAEMKEDRREQGARRREAVPDDNGPQGCSTSIRCPRKGTR